MKGKFKMVERKCILDGVNNTKVFLYLKYICKTRKSSNQWQYFSAIRLLCFFTNIVSISELIFNFTEHVKGENLFILARGGLL